MTVKEIVKVGDSLLRKKSKLIISFGTQEMIQLKEDLRETLMEFRRKYNYGRGISAVQVGVLKRVIYIQTDEFEGMLCNPVIVSKSEDLFWTWDSCFSVDAAFFVQIERYKEIEVEYHDVQGKKRLLIAKDNLSGLLQHEIDHLDGILFIDYLDRKKRRLFMREVFEKVKHIETFL